MLTDGEKIENRDTQNESLLTLEKEQKPYEIPFWKRIVLFVTGLGGIFIFSIFASFMATGLPKEVANANINLITYAFLFTALFAIIVVDLPKLLYKFKKWTNYLIGIAIGIGILVFDLVYSNIINLFYTFQVNENETSVRGVIDLYPFATLFMFGIIGPICEELTYRVGLFGALKRVNKILAYIVSMIIFAIIHFSFNAATIWNELANLPVYLFSGFMFAIAYDKLGFAGSASAHITNNLFAVGIQIIMKYIGR